MLSAATWRPYDETEALVSRSSPNTPEDAVPVLPAGGSAAGGAFRYEPPGIGVTFYISYEVIDRLGFEIMRGFGLVPRRGAEVGGILLGSAEDGERVTIRIEDFVPVPSEHLRGPSYLPSERDLTLFDEQLARHPNAVGYYRSHTREEFALGAEDCEILDSRFPSASAVCLLVRPYATRASEAALLCRGEDGRFPSGLIEATIPFRRRELGGGKPPRRRESLSEDTVLADEETAAPAPTATAETAPPTFGGLAPAPAPPGAVEPETRAGHGWVWIPLSFIFLLLGVFLGFQISISFRDPKLPDGPRENPYALGLTVEPSKESLTLRWSVGAPAIRTAERAILTISEANNVKTVDLGPEELRRGGVLYRNLTPDVRFRLEAVLDDRNSVIESARTRVVESARAPQSDPLQ